MTKINDLNIDFLTGAILEKQHSNLEEPPLWGEPKDSQRAGCVLRVGLTHIYIYIYMYILILSGVLPAQLHG